MPATDMNLTLTLAVHSNLENPSSGHIFMVYFRKHYHQVIYDIERFEFNELKSPKLYFVNRIDKPEKWVKSLGKKKDPHDIILSQQNELRMKSLILSAQEQIKNA